MRSRLLFFAVLAHIPLLGSAQEPISQEAEPQDERRRGWIPVDEGPAEDQELFDSQRRRAVQNAGRSVWKCWEDESFEDCKKRRMPEVEAERRAWLMSKGIDPDARERELAEDQAATGQLEKTYTDEELRKGVNIGPGISIIKIEKEDTPEDTSKAE